jgi:hypothetical protein
MSNFFLKVRKLILFRVRDKFTDILPDVPLEYPWKVIKQAKVMVRYHSNRIPLHSTYTGDILYEFKIKLTLALVGCNFEYEE